MRWSQFISFITHPIWMTTLLMVFVLYQKNTYLYYTISTTGKFFTIGATFLFTGLAPIISVLFYKRQNQITSIYLENRKERIMPLIMSLMYSLGLIYLLKNLNLPIILVSIAASTSMGILVTLVISTFWKISAHMMAITGVAGMYYAFLVLGQPYSPFILMALVLASGIVGYARLALKSHSLLQVLAGGFIGFPTAMISVLVVTKYL